MIHVMHHTDNDGYCSAAIVYHAIKKVTSNNTPIESVVKLHPVNYGFDFGPMIADLKKDDTIYILDFSFEPEVFKEMLEIVNDGEVDFDHPVSNVCWIDHHDSAIKKYDATGWDMSNVNGIRSTKYAGCVLTWLYFYGDIEKVDDEAYVESLIPDAVKYVGDWDTWTFKFEKETKRFNAGIKLHDVRDMNVWTDLLDKQSKAGHIMLTQILIDGKTIMAYEAKMNDRIVNSKAFTFFDALGRSWIAINSSTHSSKLFGDAENVYDFMLIFSNCRNKYWTYSIYSKNHDTREVDFCGHHSEGHPGASGFEANDCIVVPGFETNIK